MSVVGNTGTENRYLTRGRLLARNAIWNVTGSTVPLIVALFSIPILIQGLGKDRFGVLALAWALIGYASLLDIGLGRALTQAVARALGEGEDCKVPQIVWTSLILMFALGIVGTALVAGLTPWLVHRVLKIPAGLQAETIRAFYLLGFSIPTVIVTAGLRGMLEAHQRFDLVTYVRLPMGAFTFAGPLLALPYSQSLVPVVAILASGRLIGCAAHFWLCFRIAPELGRRIVWHVPSAGPLLRFGGWMTVTNTVGPLMATMDRFIIGSMLSLGAVTFYVTPYDIVTKLLLVPAAVVGVLFPAFTSSFSDGPDRAALLYRRSAKYLVLVLFPLVLLIVALAPNGLTVWLGADFAEHSSRVAQWLAVGVLANSLGLIPFTFVQGIGRPDLTAKLHLLELPFYLGLLWWLIRAFGIEGAAIAWTVRTMLDALALFLIARRFLPIAPVHASTKALPAVALFMLFLATFPWHFPLRLAFLIVIILGFIPVAWFLLLSPEERTSVGLIGEN